MMTSPIPPSPPETPGLHYYDYHPYNFPGTLLPPPTAQDGPDLRAHYGWLLCGLAGAILAASLFCAFPQPWAMFAAGAVFAGAVALFAKAHVAAGDAEDAFAQADAEDAH